MAKQLTALAAGMVLAAFGCSSAFAADDAVKQLKQNSDIATKATSANPPPSTTRPVKDPSAKPLGQTPVQSNSPAVSTSTTKARGNSAE